MNTSNPSEPGSRFGHLTTVTSVTRKTTLNGGDTFGESYQVTPKFVKRASGHRFSGRTWASANVSALSLSGDHEPPALKVTQRAFHGAKRHIKMGHQLLMRRELLAGRERACLNLAAEHVRHLDVRRSGVVRIEFAHVNYGISSHLSQPLDYDDYDG